MIPINKKTGKKIIIGAGVGAGVFIIYKYGKKWYEKQKLKKDVKDTSRKTIPGTTINPEVVARQLGQDFGWAYSVADPRRWTENDSAIVKTLLSVPKQYMSKIMIEYAAQWKRNLQADAQKYLDSDYSKVQHLFI
jgi:hypothetical protein